MKNTRANYIKTLSKIGSFIGIIFAIWNLTKFGLNKKYKNSQANECIRIKRIPIKDRKFKFLT